MRTRIVRCLLVGAVVVAAGCSSPHMKATPFYTGEYRKAEGPPGDRVNLWPIAYYRKPALSVLWPFAEFTDDHVAFRPLFSVYKLDKERHQWNFVAPLVQFDFDRHRHRVFPVFWGGGRFVAFPFVWWGEDTKGIFPAFWWKDGFAVFPFAWYEKGEHCHVLPLWAHWREPDGYQTHVLWPVFHWLDRAEKKGFRVWPFFGRYREGADERYTFALWPLCHDWREGDERTRVAFPVYFGHREKERGWRLVPPVFFRSWWDSGSLLVTPLWSSGREGKKRWDALVPLYHRSVNEETGERWLLTPLVGRLETPKRSEWALMPLLSSVARGEGETEVWALAPLVRARWGGANVQHHVLPLYYYDRNERMFLSPLVSRQHKGDEGFLNLAAMLFHHAYDGKEQDYWLAWPFAHVGWDEKSTTHHLFPLYYHRRGDDGSRTFRPLVFGRYLRSADGSKDLGFPLAGVQWGGPDGRAKAGVFPLFQWARRRWKETKEDKKSGKKTEVARREWSLGLPRIIPLFRSEWSEEVATPLDDPEEFVTTRRTREWGLFPLWRYELKTREFKAEGRQRPPRREGDFSLLGWLYDWRVREGSEMWDDKEYHEHVRSRVLWRAMHYESLDGDRSLDLFPFVTWDRKKDGSRHVSFFWRLFRAERRADGGRKLDVLFIPIVRREGKAGG